MAEKLTEQEAYKKYDDFLDNCYPVVNIGCLAFYPSRILKELDEIAYDCGFSDFCDSENIEIEE